MATHVGAAASKGKLLEVLTQGDPQDVVFTAGHGVGFPLGDSHQESCNGALVCQEWPGPKTWKGALTNDLYLGGADIDDKSSIRASVVFSFACFGAGTPRMDDFTRRGSVTPSTLQHGRSSAGCPSAYWLTRAGGCWRSSGTSIERGGCSFQWKGQQQLEVFRSALVDLLDGFPVGAAMEYFNQRYAELSTDLTSELDQIRNSGKLADDFELAAMWTANNDAVNYTIVGDPAVRAVTRTSQP